MSTRDSILHKILVCCFCSSNACGTAQCYNMWTGYEACGLANLNQRACRLYAPICHQCKMGDTAEASRRCGLCFRCIYACGL